MTRARSVALVASVAGATSILGAQQTRTGWEDVKPIGWPAQAAAPASAPASSAPTVTAETTPPQTVAAAASREPRRHAVTSRRARRGAGARRPAPPAWITLEWDGPTVISLDWTPRLLPTRSLHTVATIPAMSVPAAACAGTPIAEHPGAEAKLPSADLTLPAASLLDSSATAPMPPRPRRVAPLATVAGAKRPGFRAWMMRMAGALGIRRDAGAPEPQRVARLEGDAGR